jgi:hypothetical protein
MGRSPSSAAALIPSRALLGAALVAGLASAAAWSLRAEPPALEEDVYPRDITPPPGTAYPCALTALPRALDGIPEADRAYINRTYAVILRATQAKLVLLKALDERHDLPVALARYQDATRPLALRLGSDSPPAGLAGFQQDVQQALALQQSFFAEAVPLREGGKTMAEVYQVPQGRQASARLLSAWGRMQSRYRAWSAETKDSIYHHLCALDLF